MFKKNTDEYVGSMKKELFNRIKNSSKIGNHAIALSLDNEKEMIRAI